MGEIVVHGMIGSPFVRSALVVLEEKGRPYRLAPLRLDALKTPDYRALHPFGRVPVLVEDDFVLYETQAILRHLDRAFPEPALTPRDLRAAARMDQVLNTVDAYLFAEAGAALGFNRILAPRFLKREPDEAACARAERRAAEVLAVLAGVLGDAPYLTGDAMSLADVALACHLDFLASTPDGERAVGTEPRLGAFQARMADRPSMAETTIPALARRFLPKKG
jgi:glutathione S-transferase